ncbi:MAG: class I tRNA ligase family protein, partial [Myxococcales bacterium]|nr:class I tRNA ligase family protein [Myxococcales bacterium]
MFRRLPAPVELEEEVRRLWETHDVFARSLTKEAPAGPWVFYEGPPTANGTPHNGHVLTRVMKDVFPRFRTMRGHRVLRKAGWDTHGLPVEVEVEKQLDVHGKEAIEAYGLERFNRACVDNVFTYIEEWNELTRDIGMWLDLDDPYVTFHKPYVESVWWALARLFDKGLLYQGHKVVWWWPQGGTTLSAAEVGLGYKTVDDPAATVRFRDVDDPTLSYLAWTTTPWTLPSNVALAVNPEVAYAVCEDPEGGTVVLAADLAAAYDLVPLRTVQGRARLGRRYTPVFDPG